MLNKEKLINRGYINIKLTRREHNKLIGETNNTINYKYFYKNKYLIVNEHINILGLLIILLNCLILMCFTGYSNAKQFYKETYGKEIYGQTVYFDDNIIEYINNKFNRKGSTWIIMQ